MKSLVNSFILFSIITSLIFGPKITFADNGSHNFTAHQIAPDTGDTSTGFISGKKYVDHDFLWESWQGWDAYFNSKAYNDLSPSGLEVDINFYGYDNNVFSDGPRSELQSNEGVYWSSDVPYAYIDTTFSDSSDEPGAGLGSGYWLMALESEYYEMFTYLEDTSTTYDDYKVRVARTHKHDGGWYGDTCDGSYDNPWCRFQDGPTVEVIPNWHGETPTVDHTWHDPNFNYAYESPEHNYNTP